MQVLLVLTAVKACMEEGLVPNLFRARMYLDDQLEVHPSSSDSSSRRSRSFDFVRDGI